MRFGAPALTSRNMKEADFEKVVDFIIEGVNIAIEIKNSCEGNTQTLACDKIKRFLVADTQLYKRLCPSVGS